MGFRDRDYYRQSHSSRWGDWGLHSIPPVVRYLIFANIAVFILQMIVVREVPASPLNTLRKIHPELDRLLNEKENDPEAMDELRKEYPELDKMLKEKNLYTLLHPTERVSVVQEWFELDSRKVVRQGQVWRLLTHAFCHERYGIFHIFFNMLFLYWFGCTIESMYGAREFLLFYLAAAVVAGLAFVALDLYTGSAIPGIGASGAVLAVVMLYAMHFPREEFCIFWFIRVEMRWLMLFYIIWDLHPLLLALSGDHFFTGIAHAAHLGGLAFGFLYAKFNWRLETIADYLPRLTGRVRPRPRLRVARFPDSPHESQADSEMARVDELLQKILDSGEAGLTEEERTFLRGASQRIKRRSQRKE